MHPIILGIDPGFASLGYAVLNLTPEGPEVASLGVVRTKKSDKKQRVLAADDNIRRLRELYRPIDSLVRDGILPGQPARGRGKQVVFGPPTNVKLLCAEKMSFPRNASAAAKMAMSWGLIVASLERWGLPLLQASPQDIKRRVTGDASASKEDVQNALKKRFGRGLARMVSSLPEGEHEHAFDALASAVACLDSEEGRIVTSMMR